MTDVGPVAALACVAAFGVAGSGLAADPPPYRQDGPWQILSVAEAGTHRFDYCAAEAQFDGGLVLTIERDRAGRTVLVAETPGLTQGAHYRTRIAIGRNLAEVAAGHAAGPGTLVLPLERGAEIVGALARNRTLSLAMPNAVHTYALDGTGPAMTDLERCFANAVPREARPARRLVEAVLDRAETGPIQAAHPAGSTREEDFDYGWSSGGVAGGAKEIRIGAAAGFLDLVLTRLDRLASRCQGRFAPELDAPVEVEGAVVETGIATCRAAAGDQIAALFYFRSGDRFLEFALDASANDRKAAVAERDRIVAVTRIVALIR